MAREVKLEAEVSRRLHGDKIRNQPGRTSSMSANTKQFKSIGDDLWKSRNEKIVRTYSNHPSL